MCGGNVCVLAQVELLVTEDSPISVRTLNLFHLRKLPIPLAKKDKVVTVVEEKAQEAVALARPGFVAVVPKGVGQVWAMREE